MLWFLSSIKYTKRMPNPYRPYKPYNDSHARLNAGLKARCANYNITEDVYNETLKRQNGTCAICKGYPKRTFHIDHNHLTGEFRGILCERCNLMVGWEEISQRSKHRLELLEYLEGPKIFVPKITLRKRILNTHPPLVYLVYIDRNWCGHLSISYRKVDVKSED